MRAAPSIPLAVKVAYLGAPALVVAGMTANAGLTVYAVASAIGIFLLTFRAGEAPVLSFLCLMQWLQGTLKLLRADMLGVQVDTLAQSHSVSDAIVLTTTWPLVTALGMRLLLIARIKPKTADGLDAVTPRRLFGAYVIWTLVLMVLGQVASGGLWQIVVALGDLRWALVFALFWIVFSRKQHYALAAAVFLIELASGFLSYFSTFKTPIYILAMALPAGNYRLRPRHVAGLVLVGAMALYLATIWSAIKGEYRTTLSGGAQSQEVTLGTKQQAQELVRLFGTVDAATLDRGVTALVERISYVDFFAMTLDFVPAVRDHEDGLLWGNALRHVLMPRLFFPDKPELESDTEIARRYSGAELTWNPSTSISLGTPAESYVDYAVPFMFVPALLMGMLFGALYRYFIAYGTRAALAMGFAVSILLPMSTIELTPSKALGGLLTRVLIGLILWLFVPWLVRGVPSRALAAPHPG